MTKIQIVILSIIRYKDKYLLTLRKDRDTRMDNKWQIPGGALEFGENTIECLHRETMEELSISVNIKSLVPWIDTNIRGFWQGVLIMYLCEMKNTDDKIILNSEASDYGWFTASQIKELEAIPSCVGAIMQAERMRKSKLS